MKRKDEAHKLYYIDQQSSTAGEKIELYTWEDACELVEHHQSKYPEENLTIREFELT